MTRWLNRFATGMMAAAVALAPHAKAQAQAPALTGVVTSSEEGAMEGVLVSATRDGSTITTTVVTGPDGRYSFPASRLGPGHYHLAIRAVGYDLGGPDQAMVAAGKDAAADLKLVKTKRLDDQLTNAEWMLSAPGTYQLKNYLSNCNGCHTVQRIFESTHDPAEFQQIFQRMADYSNGSMPTHPQPYVGGAMRPFGTTQQMQPIADWLASVNLSKVDTWDYPLKTLPRPKGAATHVIMTEYKLKRPEAMPHDVIRTPDGMVWYSDFGWQYIGSLDPKTGKVTDYKLPLVKKGFPLGGLDLETDPKGNLWLSMMYQTGVAKFDRKTKKFTVYPLPAAWQADHTQESMVTPAHDNIDDVVWSNNQDKEATIRLDTKTGQWTSWGAVKDISGHGINAYGIPSDLDNNLYLLNFGGADIGWLNGKTKMLTLFPTPSPASRPRRGRVDRNDDLWFAEYGANAIGFFDHKAQTIKEYKLPTPFSDPYDVVHAPDGSVWTGGMTTDRVDRLDPKTGQIVEYLLPRETNIRRVFVDQQGTLWIGSNHGNEIVEVQVQK